MGMFDTVGTAAGQERRKENTLRKLERMKKSLRHEEPDRVPVSDFFWGGFIERWRKELGLPADANPYYYYDLDWIVTVSNMDPWIRPFETIKETQRRSGGQDRLRGHHAEGVPLPHAGVHRLGDRHAGEARSGRVRRSPRPAALLFGGRQSDCRRGRRLRAELAALDRHGQVALARFPGLRQHHRVLRVHDADDRPAEPHDVDRVGAGADGGRAAPRRRVLSGMRQGGDRRRPGRGSTAS